jgi:hypothetical protein
LKVLKKADISFERKEGQNETAINAKGFEVDFLRRQAIENDPHPFRSGLTQNAPASLRSASRTSVLSSPIRLAGCALRKSDQFLVNEEDLWPVQATRASVLTTAPKFEHVIISSNGKMAMMNTISPATFVEFKSWMAEAPYREEIKRRRDRLQAGIVQELIEQGLFASDC